MANFDLDKLMLIDPLCDPNSDETVKTSKHANQVIKDAELDTYDRFDKLRDEFDFVVGTTSVMGSDYNIPRTPIEIRDFVDKIDDDKNIAIVFGNEGTGLTNNEISKCDFLITIPSSKKYSALNISHAASIIFYEIYNSFGQNKLNSHIKSMTPDEKKFMLWLVYNTLDKLEFATPEKKETQKKVWKSVFAKSMMSKREAYAIIGGLKKINDKF